VTASIDPTQPEFGRNICWTSFTVTAPVHSFPCLIQRYHHLQWLLEIADLAISHVCFCIFLTSHVKFVIVIDNDASSAIFDVDGCCTKAGSCISSIVITTIGTYLFVPIICVADLESSDANQND
jgi:hypothetical protein